MRVKAASNVVEATQRTREVGVAPAPTARAPARKTSRGMRKLKRIGWNLLPPLTFVAIVGVVGGWRFRFSRFPPYLLPGPAGVFARVITDAPHAVDPFAGHADRDRARLRADGASRRFPLGLLIALSPLAKQIVYPPIMLLQLVPKIAVAPLFLVWLGFGIESKVLLTVLMTFFPLLLASISGFQILDDRAALPDAVDGRDAAGRPSATCGFPAALPVIFSGIKTSATIAATAAIVAEFVGANKGLGYVLLRGTEHDGHRARRSRCSSC